MPPELRISEATSHRQTGSRRSHPSGAPESRRSPIAGLTGTPRSRGALPVQRGARLSTLRRTRSRGRDGADDPDRGEPAGRRPHESSSLASDVSVARFGLRISRAMQPPAARGKTGECVARESRRRRAPGRPSARAREQPDDRYPGIVRREARDVAASRCRQCARRPWDLSDDQSSRQPRRSEAPASRLRR